MWSKRESAMRVRMGDMADNIIAKAHDLVLLEVSAQGVFEKRVR